jgi:hypothetical protein
MSSNICRGTLGNLEMFAAIRNASSRLPGAQTVSGAADQSSRALSDAVYFSVAGPVNVPLLPELPSTRLLPYE